MQSQMNKNNRMFLSDSTVPQDNYHFYNMGKEMFKGSYEVQDELEDKLRQ